MPIYEYRCNACGMEKEFLQKLSDPLLTTCPACGKEALVKKLTAAGFQLKGSGWYVTDFRNNGAAPTTKDASKDGKPADDKSVSADAGAEPAKAAGKTGETGGPETKDTKSTTSTPATTPAPSTGGGTGSASSSTS